MRYFALSSLAGATRNQLSVADNATATWIDTAYVNTSIQVPSSGSGWFLTEPFLADGDEFWTRYDYFTGAGGSTGSGPHWLDGATPIFRFTGSTAVPAYWNSVGGVWVTGTAWALPGDSRSILCLKMDFLNAAYEVYQAGALVASAGPGLVGFPTQCTQFRGAAMRGSTAFYSQIMGADYDLRDAHLMRSPITGNSAANTDGTGAYTDVNENVLNEATAVILNAAGKKGFTHSAITVPGGYGIAARCINARGRVSGGVVSDGKIGIRSGGANYSSAGLLYNGGYEPRGVIVEADPNTGGAWTQTSFNAAEDYVEAA